MKAKCGVPRWAHLIRTHEPDVVKPASVAFTEMSVRCLCAILRVDYDQVDPQAYRQIRMPIRHGGLGLHDWAERAEDAYQASINNESKRDIADDPYAPAEAKVKEDGMWEDMMDALKEENKPFFDHLKRSATNMSTRWLVGDITAASSQPSNLFRAALLHRLRWAGAHPDHPTTFKCRCAYPQVKVRTTSYRDMVLHLAGCSKNGGPTKRHHLVREALAGLLNRAGYSVQQEVPLSPELRMDIIATPHEGPAIFIDTTVPNTTGLSLRTKNMAQVDKAKDSEKSKKYEEYVKSVNGRYLTFTIDIHGKMSQTAKTFLSEVTAKIKTCAPETACGASLTYTALTTTLSKALAFGNGMCLLRSQQMHLFGVRLGDAPARIYAPGMPLAPTTDAPSASEQPTPSPELDAPDEAFYEPPNDFSAGTDDDAHFSSCEDEPQPQDPDPSSNNNTPVNPLNGVFASLPSLPDASMHVLDPHNGPPLAPSVRDSIARITQSIRAASVANFQAGLLNNYLTPPRVPASQARPLAEQPPAARLATA